MNTGHCGNCKDREKRMGKRKKRRDADIREEVRLKEKMKWSQICWTYTT